MKREVEGKMGGPGGTVEVDECFIGGTPQKIVTLASGQAQTKRFHLDRYVDEQVFRFNTSRTMRMDSVSTNSLSQLAGKRLTLAEVTGKVGEREARF